MTDMAYAQAVDEIIVTARKKEETLLDAPLAISAFGELELEEAGFENIIDISKATPGLFIEEFNQTQARVNSTPRFRGVFLATDNRLQQTATVFLDGIAITGGIESIGINELQRVEVIKGPQSALFGRNTFAGAINFVTKDPSEEFQADIDLTAATRGEFRVAAGIEGPISEDLFYRIGGSWSESDGHYDNFAVEGDRLGDESQWNINGSLLYEPNDAFRIKVRGSYRELDDGPGAFTGGAFGPDDHNFGGFLFDANCNTIPGTSFNDIGGPSSNTPCSIDVLTGSARPRTGSQNPRNEVGPGPNGEFFGRSNSFFRGTITGGAIPLSDIGVNSSFDVIETFRGDIMGDARFNPATNGFANGILTFSPFNKDDFGLDLEEIRFSVDASYDISENVTFSFLGGYSEEAYGLYTELDLTPDDSFPSFIANDITDYSLEARLNGTLIDDRLNWTVGGSFVDVDIKRNAATASNLFFPVVFGDVFRTDAFRTGAETLGIFGSLDYEFTDKLSVTLEGRYQEDKIFDRDVSLAEPGLTPLTITNFVPRATARYEPSDITTLYATYSQGNLPGGFNPEIGTLGPIGLDDVLSTSPSAGLTFDEETLTNYELGWKQSFDEGRGGFNLAAFYMNRKDEIARTLQTTIEERPENLASGNTTRTVAFNVNGATTNIYGFELDANWQTSDNLTLQGSLAYVDARIESFPDGAGTDRFGLVFGPNADVAGQQAPRFPPWSGSFGAVWEQPINVMDSFDTWFLRGDAYYSGQYFTSNANLTQVDDAVDVNVRTGLRGDNMSLELFVSNLFAEDTPSGVQTFANVAFETRFATGGFFNFNNIGNRVSLRDKRQFGVRAKYTFR